MIAENIPQLSNYYKICALCFDNFEHHLNKKPHREWFHNSESSSHYGLKISVGSNRLGSSLLALEWGVAFKKEIWGFSYYVKQTFNFLFFTLPQVAKSLNQIPFPGILQ